jgi:hypothetical protein
MVIVTALGFSYLDLPDSTAKRLGWIITLDGWSNIGFYFFGNISPDRGLAFGQSRFGPSNIFSILTLAPAYLFGVLAMGAFGTVGYHALFGNQQGAAKACGINQRANEKQT